MCGPSSDQATLHKFCRPSPGSVVLKGLLNTKLKLMRLEDFKVQFGVPSIPLQKTADKKSNRLIAFCANNIQVLTTEDFDMNLPVAIYPNPKGVEGRDFILSNSLGAEIVATF